MKKGFSTEEIKQFCLQNRLAVAQEVIGVIAALSSLYIWRVEGLSIWFSALGLILGTTFGDFIHIWYRKWTHRIIHSSAQTQYILIGAGAAIIFFFPALFFLKVGVMAGTLQKKIHTCTQHEACNAHCDPHCSSHCTECCDHKSCDSKEHSSHASVEKERTQQETETIKRPGQRSH